MTNNRKIANSILMELKRNNLVPTNIQFLDGYFIFDMGEDSVVHFHIRGIKKWKFGLWICTDLEDDAVQFFAQREDNIDKFKPSASVFTETVSKDRLKHIVANKSNTEYVYWNIVKLCNHIKNNPRIAVVQEFNYSPKYIDTPFLRTYISTMFTHYKYRVGKNKRYVEENYIVPTFNNICAKIAKEKYSYMVEDVVIDDKCKGPWIVSPRYDVQILFKRLYENDVKQGYAMYEFEKNTWFHKLFTDKYSCIQYYVDKISRDNEWS